jgi:hypothetical protein
MGTLSVGKILTKNKMITALLHLLISRDLQQRPRDATEAVLYLAG